MPRSIEVRTASRLHLGLYALAASPDAPHARSYGGVGVMVARPGLRLRMTEAAQREFAGGLAERMADAVARWSDFYQLPAPAARLELAEAPPAHVGLGTGTQLALAVAAALCAWHGRPAPSPEELAASVGRGRRSAVGAYGFLQGGLIAERGKLPGESLAPLDLRLEFPPAWRFVLVRPAGRAGLAGAAEEQALASLPPGGPETTESLVRLAREALLPAAAAGDFARFSDSLYRFGTLSGSLYAAYQGGPFNGPLLNLLIERLRRLGATGVGQSSWGPTLFALQPDEDSAADLADRLRREPDLPPLETLVTPAENRGAQVIVRGD